jgi:hypothetical protein
MWFVKVLAAIKHDQNAGHGMTRELLLCNLHRSACNDRVGPQHDSMGLIVFSAQPYKEHNITTFVIPAEEIAPARISVVPHATRANTMVALTRQPHSMFMRAARFPVAC